jgi:dTDP-4-dehydrorhamnose 3,5-epimerase
VSSGIPGVQRRDLSLHGDERGRFVEMLRASEFSDDFVQANHSRSAEGVLRGLHYHIKQADLWYVVRGTIQVGLADLRQRIDRPLAETHILDETGPSTLYIPSGVAHGFLALTEVDLIYFVTREYDAADEFGVAWNDPILNVQWRTQDPALSKRDRDNPDLQWELIPSFS